MTKSEAIDRSGWGPGPWDGEPDRVEFTHCGLPCLMVRNPTLGNWCGYVAVPPSDPRHGKDYDSIDVDVHGGLTYAAACFGHICHTPQQGESDNVWWFGFDCAHAFDKCPAMDAIRRQLRERSLFHKRPQFENMGRFEDVYRDMAYVRSEVERLAEQLGERG